jgi:hypothetical protein
MKGPLGCISHAILEGLAELVREPRPHIPLALSPCERSGVGSTSVVRVDVRISVKQNARGGRERTFSLQINYHLDCKSCRGVAGQKCQTGNCTPYFRSATLITVMERDPRTRAEEQKTYCLLPNKPYDALRVKLQVEYKGYARRSQTKLQRKFFQLQLEGTEYIYSANRFTAEGQLSISSDAIGVEDDSPTFEEEEGMANDDSDEPGRMIATLSKALTERTFMNRERCASRVLIKDDNDDDDQSMPSQQLKEEEEEEEEEEDDDDDNEHKEDEGEEEAEVEKHPLAISEVRRKRGGLWITPKEQHNFHRASNLSPSRPKPRPHRERGGTNYFPDRRLHTLQVTMLRVDDFIKRVDGSLAVEGRLSSDGHGNSHGAWH